MRIVKSLCKECGTCMVPLIVMVVLYNSGSFSLPMRELRKILDIDNSNLHSVAVEMEKEGYISMRKEGKFSIVSLSVQGRYLLENISNFRFLGTHVRYDRKSDNS